MSNLDYDLAVNDQGGLILFVYRQDGEPDSPSVLCDRSLSRLVFRRDSRVTFDIEVTAEAARTALEGVSTLLVTEVDEDDPERALSYDLPIEKL